MAMKKIPIAAVLVGALFVGEAQAQSPSTITAVETCWSEFVACLAAGGPTCQDDYASCIDALTISPADLAGGLEGCVNDYLSFESMPYDTLHCIKAWHTPAFQMALGTEIDDPCRLPLELHTWARDHWMQLWRVCVVPPDPTEAATCEPLVTEGNTLLSQVEELDGCVL